MDPNLIRDADPAGVLLFFGILAAIAVGTWLFNTSRRGDWIDERLGRGSIEDDWGLPPR